VFGPILLTLGGSLLIGLGLWGGHELRTPYQDIVAWSAPIGLVMVLLGVVLLFIPAFFIK
jgi:hypothetical protein